MNLTKNTSEHTKCKSSYGINKKKLRHEMRRGHHQKQGWLGPAIKDATSSMIASQTERVDSTTGLLNQVGYSMIQGIGIGLGIEILSKIWHEEKIEVGRIAKKSFVLGVDFGVKTLSACLLKKAVKLGLVSLIPSYIEAGTIANISYIIIENMKVIGMIILQKGKIDNCLKIMEMTTLEIILGIVISAKGVELGSNVGIIFGYIGIGAGGFLGGTIGYIIGFKFAEVTLKIIDTLVTGEEKFRKNIVRNIIDILKEIKNEFTTIF